MVMRFLTKKMGSGLILRNKHSAPGNWGAFIWGGICTEIRETKILQGKEMRLKVSAKIVTYICARLRAKKLCMYEQQINVS